MSQPRKRSSTGNYEFAQWMPALLDCLRALGGSSRPREVIEWITRNLDVPTVIAETTLKSGQSRFYNQVHWARQYLVWDGLLDDARRGMWTLTPLGWRTQLSHAEANALVRKRVQTNRSQTDVSAGDIGIDASASADTHAEAMPPDEAQEHALLALLKGLPSYGFELLCERLLREHGFEDVAVTRKSRDGGIDGYGVLRLSPFVSMKVAFQSKRYRGSVSRQEVGQFRNDLLGKAEKGVLITTGRFTCDAVDEASKAGAVPIELIDGDRLVELFEEKQLGVKPRQIFEIDQSFFDQFRDK